MIFTVTLNPSLDYVVSVDDFQLGRTNRTTYEQIYPGGKGINVSMMLNNLGIETTVLGFKAGFIGDKIAHLVEQSGINAEFIALEEGDSRINVKLKSMDGTEINGCGPFVPEEKVNHLMKRLDELTGRDILVLAGSIPASLSDDFYRDIMKRLEDKDIMVVVDTTGSSLLQVLQYHPFLIKPNKDELEEIFKISIKSREDCMRYAKELQSMGAQNVLVSLGGDGAVLAAADGEGYYSAAPEGNLINAVGAGDSMVAGFLAGWLEKRDYKHAFYMGISAGSASAFSEYLADRESVKGLFQHITMKEEK